MRFSSLQWLILLSGFQGIVTLNIVAIATLGTTSHFIWTNTIISRLVERGHKIVEVTVKDTPPHPNRTTFSMKEAMFSPESVIELIESKNNGGHFLYEINEYYRQITLDAKAKLNSKAFKRLISHFSTSNEKVDLILIDYSNRDALLSISHLLGHPPIVAMTAFNHPATFSTIMGNLHSPTQAPHDLTPYSCEMSLSQRISNVLGYVYSRLVERFYFEPSVNAFLGEHFGKNAPTLTDLESNISVALVNTHPATHCQRPVLPSVVEVGFLHIATPKSLPKDIQLFLDGASEGAIVISFGSVVRLELMPIFQNEITAVFGKMKQRFLLKIEHPPKTLPANVRAYKWLPQSDVLAHPNVRLLVAHGGTLSTQEAVYHGVPVILIPFYLDQHGNALRIANLGAGRALLNQNLNAHTLEQEMTTVLDDPAYTNRMKRLSSISRDQPESPLERAIFWIEFVGRHRGAPHFRTANRQMSWIQLYAIDVIGILLLGIIITTTLFAVLLLKLKTSVLAKEKVA